MDADFKQKISLHFNGLPGFDSDAFFNSHELNEEVVSVRLNSFKTTGNFNDLEKVPWCESGRYLTKRPSFTFDPLFHAGSYYVQEASSMFLEHVLKTQVNLNSPLRILDLCAAPGGKSTLVGSIISSESVLVSNEVIHSRAITLRDNLIRWGNANNIVTCNDVTAFSNLKCFFDIIIVDAPCSGSGMFRKDHGSLAQWSENNVNLCSQRQQKILANVLPSLKKNGLLIYSTCSFSKQENEDIADKLVSGFDLESNRIPCKANWGIVETVSKNSAFGYRFYPYNLKGEGFYLSCFKKNASITNEMIHIRPSEINNKNIEFSILDKFIEIDERFQTIRQKDEVYLIPENLISTFRILEQAKFAILNKGVHLGVIKGNELIPSHHQALSLLKKKPLFFESLADLKDCIDYLKGADLKKNWQFGWRLISFNQHHLGWYKQLNNRANNYYPKNLRIQKQKVENRSN